MSASGFDVVLFLVMDPTTFELTLAREVKAARVEELLAAYRGIRYPHIEAEGVDLLDQALSAYHA